MEKLIIIGAGPHSEVIVDIIEQCHQYEIVGLTDQKEGAVFGHPILGNDSILPDLLDEGVHNAFVAIGNNRLRKLAFTNVEHMGFNLINVISPDAFVSKYAVLERGIAIMRHAIINTNVHIGTGAIINTNASIDHDCDIGCFAHIAPGCAVSGSTLIGDNTILGTGTNVIDNIHIGHDVIIGSGAAVVKNIPDYCEAVGVPAKVIKKLRHNN